MLLFRTRGRPSMGYSCKTRPSSISIANSTWRPPLAAI
ncbi:Uncharacterised protein [Bordetella pertussis]|nr:Uncharacterised protein [Bordetella pertussis]